MFVENPNLTAEGVSLALTWPLIIPALYLLKIVGRDLRHNMTRSRRWLLVGIFLGFFGSVWDNGYWAIPWSLSYIGSPHQDLWFANGVLCNIPFRQIAGITAVYCHLRAFILWKVEINRTDQLTYTLKKLNFLFLFSTLLGGFYWLALEIIRTF